MNPGAYYGIGGEGAPAYPRTARLWHSQSTPVHGQTTLMIPAHSSNSIGTELSALSPGAQFDEFFQRFLLAAGKYNIMQVYQKQAGGGILTLEIDGAVIGSVDHFTTPSATQNNMDNFDFEVPYDGLHELRGKVHSRNVSSVGYVCNVNFWIIRERIDYTT